MKIWKEKKNYHAIFVGEVGDATWRKYSFAHIIDLFQFESLSWNQFEKRAIDQIINTNNYLLKINKFDPTIIHREQIVILEKEQFAAMVSRSEIEFYSGYIYICRNDNRAQFISDLAREITRLSSFYSLRIEEKDDKKVVTVAQSGYSLKLSHQSYIYNALNEAVTELWSKQLLQQLFSVDKDFLSKEEKNGALRLYNYPRQQRLLEEIFYKTEANTNLIKPMFKSYFNGSLDFLQILEDKLPLVLTSLRGMGKREKSVITAAYLIDGDELVKKISMK